MQNRVVVPGSVPMVEVQVVEVLVSGGLVVVTPPVVDVEELAVVL